MGHMKWIYSMVIDGSYKQFEKEYIKCVLTNKQAFMWDNLKIDKLYAKNIVKYIYEHLPKSA